MTELGVTVAGATLALLGAAGLWRQYRRSGTEETIRLVSSRSLGGKRFVAIVEVHGERLLLGVSETQVTLVARLGAAQGGDPASAAG